MEAKSRSIEGRLEKLAQGLELAVKDGAEGRRTVQAEIDKFSKHLGPLQARQKTIEKKDVEALGQLTKQMDASAKSLVTASSQLTRHGAHAWKILKLL